MQHANAPLTRTGRHRMVMLVEKQGLTFEAAAAASNVARSTVHLWVWRWREASAQERATLACLTDRSSRPKRCPRMLSSAEHERVCKVRRRTGWGPRLIATEVGVPHATVHRALRRRGCSRRPQAPRPAVRRYEWPCPGNLLHMDTKRHACFERPGHAVTGDRTRRTAGAGFEFVHTIEDDCSRLAYSEAHDDEQAATVAAFTERALDWFLELGIVTERILTDNAWCYTKSKDLRELLRARAIEHWKTSPIARRPTARSSACSRPWTASGGAASPTTQARTVAELCHTGFATTTSDAATQLSATARLWHVFGTSWGTTPRRQQASARRLRGAGRLRLQPEKPGPQHGEIVVGEAARA
jgi:transposase